MIASQCDNRPVTCCRQDGLTNQGTDAVPDQYVYSSRLGLFRIVRHGHRWRSLLDERELGRHESAGSALDGLRDAWPAARLPRLLGHWRYLPGLTPARARIAHRAALHWRMAG